QLGARPSKAALGREGARPATKNNSQLTDRSVIQVPMPRPQASPTSRLPRRRAPGSRRESPPPRRRMPEQRAGHILNAALEAFVENGFAATRLEDVAQRAGVSKGTLYLYFENKEALFKAAVRENVVPFLDRAE